MGRVIWMALLVLLGGCRGYEASEAEVLVTKVQYSVTQKLCAKYDALFIGEFAMMPEDEVEVVGICLQLRRELTQDELRAILVDGVEELQNAVNSEAALRPYLNNYPATARNVDLTLFLVKPSGYGFYYPKISVASSLGGSLYYKTEMKGIIAPPYTAITESFEEAKAKLQNPPKPSPQEAELRALHAEVASHFGLLPYGEVDEGEKGNLTFVFESRGALAEEEIRKRLQGVWEELKERASPREVKVYLYLFSPDGKDDIVSPHIGVASMTRDKFWFAIQEKQWPHSYEREEEIEVVRP